MEAGMIVCGRKQPRASRISPSRPVSGASGMRQLPRFRHGDSCRSCSGDRVNEDEVVPQMRLGAFDNSTFDRGRPRIVEMLWLAIQTLLVSSSIPGSWHRKFLLRMFGAKIGVGVVVKPGVRVKFPWRLLVGSDSWIGEDAWLDNL